MSERHLLLQSQGYRVEDMGAKWPLNYAGKFRWVNARTGHTQPDNELSTNAQDAWHKAFEHWKREHTPHLGGRYA